MAHHSDFPFGNFPNYMDEFRKSMPDQQADRLNDLITKNQKNLDLGATKKFTDGKLTDTDEGEIKFGITHAEDRVIMNFNTPVHWIGFTKEQAMEVAATLITHSNKI
jgi:hypothetical protein